MINKRKTMLNTEIFKRNRIDEVLMQINDIKVEDEKINIFEYWRKNKDTFKEFYRLFKIVFSINDTQASVERAFSSLKYIYNDYREKLDGELMEDILCVRLNSRIIKYFE